MMVRHIRLQRPTTLRISMHNNNGSQKMYLESDNAYSFQS